MSIASVFRARVAGPPSGWVKKPSPSSVGESGNFDEMTWHGAGGAVESIGVLQWCCSGIRTHAIPPIIQAFGGCKRRHVVKLRAGEAGNEEAFVGINWSVSRGMTKSQECGRGRPEERATGATCTHPTAHAMPLSAEARPHETCVWHTSHVPSDENRQSRRREAAEVA